MENILFWLSTLTWRLGALVFEFPVHFLVVSGLDYRWVILTVIGGAELLFHVPGYIFADIRRLLLINQTIFIRLTDFGPASIPRFEVTANEVIHDGFPALKDSEPQRD